MAKKNKEKAAVEANAAPTNGVPRNIFALANRGMLLDVFVFLVNVFLMRLLTKQFVALINEASDSDLIAQYAMFLFCIGIFVLPASGAVLKRWRFHQRLQLKGNTIEGNDFAMGCLFNPIIYFSVNLIIFVVISTFVLQYKYGGGEESATATAIMLFLGIALPAVQTFLVYRYFSPPKKEPPIVFLKSPLSELLGDICIFTNMILFQLVWNWLLFSYLGFTRVSDFFDFISRIFFLIAAALLIYFPPRIFYLGEDITRRRVWLTMLLANLPVIFRVLIGTNSANW